MEEILKKEVGDNTPPLQKQKRLTKFLLKQLGLKLFPNHTAMYGEKIQLKSKHQNVGVIIQAVTKWKNFEIAFSKIYEILVTEEEEVLIHYLYRRKAEENDPSKNTIGAWYFNREQEKMVKFEEKK